MQSVYFWGYIAHKDSIQCNKQDLAHNNASLSCLLLFNPTISIWSGFCILQTGHNKIFNL